MKQMLLVFSLLLFLLGLFNRGLHAQDKQVEPNASKRDKTEVYERVNLPDRSWMEVERFTSKGKQGVKNRSGKIIVRPVYDEISRFQSFGTVVIAKVRQADKWGLIDIAGKEVIHPKYDEIASLKYSSQWRAKSRFSGRCR